MLCVLHTTCVLHTNTVYTAHRSVYCTHERNMREKRDCWVCNKCGFAWLVKNDAPPSHCASSKCRSRVWNLDEESSQSKKVPVKETESPEEGVPFEEPIKPPPGKPLKPKPVKATSCPECFAMNGQHQKGCSKKRK